MDNRAVAELWEATVPHSMKPRGILLVLSIMALLLGVLAAGPAPSAAATDNPDRTAVHRLTVGLYAYVCDDQDSPFVFRAPCPVEVPNTTYPPSYTNITVVDLPALAAGSPLFAGAGELSHGTGLRLPWWRGPFRDASGLGALPAEGPIRLCFKDQRATWTVHPGNAFRVRTRVGLFDGAVNLGCDPNDLKAEADLSVAAPPTGLRVCGQPIRLEDDGDVAAALLCLTNERIDPRPVAAPRNGNSGTAPFTVVLDGASSVVPNGVAQWHWAFGDGQTATGGPVVNHLYSAPGSYPVTLRITDTTGLVRSAGVLTVTVHPPPIQPVARISGPATVRAGNPATFDASASTPGSGIAGVIGEYWWDFGDGQQAITRVPMASISHVYAQPGAYTARVTVHTLDLRTATATATLTVTTPVTAGVAIRLPGPGGP